MVEKIETLAELAPKGNEPISEEEVLSLGEDLGSNSRNPATALKILKILDRKDITATHLEKTKIGKKLTAVIDTPDPEVAESNEAQLMQELTEMKAYLKKKWLQVHKRHKKLKSMSSELNEPDTPAADEEEKFEIPYIPQETTTGDPRRDF